MKKLFILLSALVLPVSAFAQRVDSAPSQMAAGAMGSQIAAVVNDSVITTVDLEQRMRIAILSSGLPNTGEVRMHLLPQIMRALIEEQLQAQEAKRLGFSVSGDEIDQALAQIARDNRVEGSLLSFLNAQGISSEAMISQVRSGLLWSKVVQREVRAKVEISDEEVTSVIDRMRANEGKEEYLVSEIFLAVENPKDEPQVLKIAENLVDRIRGGANFAAVAHQFSQGMGAAQGGDIGWLQQGQLSRELDRALASATPGQVSAPIRTSEGFHILGVRGKRTISLGKNVETKLGLIQTFRSFAEGDKPALLKDATRLRSAVKSCSSIEKDMSGFSGWKVQKLGEMNLSKAPAWFADKVRGVSVGGSSEPLETEKGVVVLFVCSRSDNANVNRDAIMNAIGAEKMELQARRLLRDLRRSAYIDVRLGRR